MAAEESTSVISALEAVLKIIAMISYRESQRY